MSGDRTGIDRQPPGREPVYRIIALLAIADMVVGGGLVLYSLLAGGAVGLVWVGAGLAAIGALLFFFFRSLAARAGAARRP